MTMGTPDSQAQRVYAFGVRNMEEARQADCTPSTAMSESLMPNPSIETSPGSRVTPLISNAKRHKSGILRVPVAPLKPAAEPFAEHFKRRTPWDS